MIGIIYYGAGNLHSVEKAVRKLGFRAKIVTNANEAAGVRKIIFPGVGNAGNTMQTIRDNGLDVPIKRFIEEGMPFLGICLGMQLLLEFSHENDAECLAVLEGEVKPFERPVKVPHMSWNQVVQSIAHPIYSGIPVERIFNSSIRITSVSGIRPMWPE
ncbi:imidazole glycerol phosphate synthase subunit HisH [Paenibacillus hemerocallicola]|uniref:Imidazole glycerol phosphate synthase subunit HisH n=1 Tax=Paenibacillus hemerocallicola TaxID=1172614 RepID=A0A5C4SW91_9BACL|nr:imidazole glycerol phosphate synthase subunit HisH [Paenibacillus hemerocallicola]TNJ57729.1 imidazole glycerol phosphate synthase subunit HisH [Paenibacillus hemerocallicola]